MIGILQGRLTEPWNGQLQCFPRDAWEAEFFRARELGFEAIEVLVEAEYNPANPVWEEGMASLRKVSAESGVAARVACADCFMKTTFIGQPDAALGLLERIASRGFERIVLPFFDAAALQGPEDLDRLAGVLARSPVRGRRLALETTLPAAMLAPFVDRVGASVCYDLGNTTALGHDIVGDIRILGGRISHVHVKDKRRATGENVVLGTGDTDFAGAAAALSEVGFKGDYTCETTRGNDPIGTARLHRSFVQALLGAHP
jgi:sugar phosphate isomerase/epimerase